MGLVLEDPLRKCLFEVWIGLESLFLTRQLGGSEDFVKVAVSATEHLADGVLANGLAE